MFTTPLEDFDYDPLIINGEIVKGKVKLSSCLRWETDLPVWWEETIEIVVPAGFIFNLASIPWMFGWFAGKLGKHQRAACLHDYLYCENIGSRQWADKQFDLAMKQDGVASFRRRGMWAAVRLGGWGAWK